MGNHANAHIGPPTKNVSLSNLFMRFQLFLSELVFDKLTFSCLKAIEIVSSGRYIVASSFSNNLIIFTNPESNVKLVYKFRLNGDFALSLYPRKPFFGRFLKFFQRFSLLNFDCTSLFDCTSM
ncbi:hypothetical protein ALC60_13306 [Trachymyrmex zeteki]|uniref:Uncharacterized protein n=1 Tax=Mycetomoellerius zeteki TaxID=64791 RepID=A0A151WI73_9HYME|nr:hypothetical protein ALC60_13306 [Trachymyrmex zeteki]